MHSARTYVQLMVVNDVGDEVGDVETRLRRGRVGKVSCEISW